MTIRILKRTAVHQRRQAVAGGFALCLAVMASAGLGQSVSLTTLDGQPTNLSTWKQPNQWTLVMIWAHDCHVCNQEASAISDFHLMHSDADAAARASVVGISIDGAARRDKAIEFVENHQLEFPNLVGEVRAVAEWLRRESGQPLRGTPTFLLYDQNGRLRAAQAGRISPEVVEQFIREHS